MLNGTFSINAWHNNVKPIYVVNLWFRLNFQLFRGFMSFIKPFSFHFRDETYNCIISRLHSHKNYNFQGTRNWNFYVISNETVYFFWQMFKTKPPYHYRKPNMSYSILHLQIQLHDLVFCLSFFRYYDLSIGISDTKIWIPPKECVQ